MKNILVTGGNGFIGQHIIHSLEGQRLEGQRQHVIPFSLRGMWDRGKFNSVDTVINLVGKAHDHEGQASEAEYVHANVALAKEVFNAFRDSEQAKLLIHVSSLAAVEEFESKTMLTEHAECRPVSIYGRTKRAAEQWLLAQDLPPYKKLIILRPPMIHGPGDKGSLGLLFRIVSKGMPYPLAAFDNTRSFISIDNFSFFIQQIIAKQDRMRSGIYHVAEDEAFPTKELIRLIGEVSGQPARMLSVPKSLVRLGARMGDYLPLPLNTLRLRKLTSTLLVSNVKIKSALGEYHLPENTRNGLIKTLKSF